jgi:tryptophan synthase beta chain
MSEQIRFLLNESDLPRAWYNILADSPVAPSPVLNPMTKQPVTPDFLAALFPMGLIEQEISQERFIDIPEEVREIYKLWRPTPLLRARRLEKELATPAHIYYKYEGVSPSGSHKSNSAVPQAYYNKIAGTRAMTTETGAGQWGSALAMACQFYSLDLEVYMVRVSYQQKPYRRHLIETYGAQIFPSPSNQTRIGRELLAQNPDHLGSLGIAISEAVEVAAGSGGRKKYGLGSVLNHVLLHQTVIGEEALKQMDMAGEYPDVVIGCAGGGSNLGGLMAAFMQDKLTGKKNARFVAVEPASCPSMTRGKYAYDFCDTGRITPLARMYTLGSDFIPSPNHAGGLRYHGMSPILSKLYHDGYMEAIAVEQNKVFEAATLFAKQEQILPAPESAHAIYGAVQEALRCKESGEAKTILFGLTGTGYFDMQAYTQFNEGTMSDYVPTDKDLQRGFNGLPKV